MVIPLALVGELRLHNFIVTCSTATISNVINFNIISLLSILMF